MSDPDRLVEGQRRGLDAARELDCLVMIGTIAARVAHEINNPLASIQNAFLLVKDAIPPSHPHYAYVAAIERDIQRIATVTRTLAETYRPEHDRAVGVAVSTIVGDAVRLAVHANGVRVEVDNRVHNAFAAPAGLLRHALQQVLDVAVRSSDGGEPIRVKVRAATDGLSVRVHYHDAGASVQSAAKTYSDRLIAAMGGTVELIESQPGWKELALHLPTIVRPEGSE